MESPVDAGFEYHNTSNCPDFVSIAVSQMSTSLPPTNPFENLWCDPSARENTSHKINKKKRLFPKLFSRQATPKMPPREKRDATPIPPVSSISSSSAFPNKSFGKSRGSTEPTTTTSYRSVASGSIYTSMSFATTDSQRKKMTNAELKWKAKDVLGSLGGQKEQNHHSFDQTKVPSEIVGSTILVGHIPDSCQLKRGKVVETPPAEPMHPIAPSQLAARSLPLRKNHRLAFTPVAPLRFQQHTTVPAPGNLLSPPSLQFGASIANFKPIAPPPRRFVEELHETFRQREEKQKEKHVGTPSLSGSVSSQQPTIEIARGVSVPLRGFSAETHDYVTCRAIASHTCSCCCSKIHCINDAEFILCPNCRVLESLVVPRSGGGVALGFTQREYMEWTANNTQF